MAVTGIEEIIQQCFPGLPVIDFFLYPGSYERHSIFEAILYGQLLPKAAKLWIDQRKIDSGIGKFPSRYPENLFDRKRLKHDPEESLAHGKLNVHRHGIKTIDKSTR